MKSIEFVIDTSAWIEYFRGSSRGAKVRTIIEKSVIGTSILSVAELSDKYEREGMMMDFSKDLAYVAGRSAIILLELEDATKAGQLKQEVRREKEKFGLVDALILLQTRRLGGQLITFDRDFEGLENTKVLG